RRGAGGERVLAGAEHAERRDGRGAAIPVEAEGDRQGGELKLVEPQGADQRVAPAAIDQVAAAGQYPGLRPAEQLVGGETDQVHTRADSLADRGLVLDLPDGPGA